MTVRNYLAKLKAAAKTVTNRDGNDFAEVMLGEVSIWSNAACIGYVKQAMQACRYSPAEQEKLLCALTEAFENHTVEEAERL